MKTHHLFLLGLLFFGCANSSDRPSQGETVSISHNPESAPTGVRHFSGPISNGMKGDSIFFDISANGKQMTNVTFKGYWRCSGKLESMTAGPKDAFDITGGKVNGHISEPPNGGSTAWRFEVVADIAPKTASGTFRMNINNLGCDTYKLKWTAVAK